MEPKPAAISANASAPWGAHSPRGKQKLLRALVQLGLARGLLKRWFHRQWIAGGSSEPVDIVTHGLRMRLYPHDNTTDSKLVLASRERDREEFEFLSRYMTPGGTFLDVGANIGFYSLIMTARGAGRVLAVEPLPVAFERLQFNIRANGFEDRIFALQAALGPERGIVSINMTPGDLGGSSIVKTALPGSAIEVQMLPLYDALREREIAKIDAMKIDVEGFEDSVLEPFFKVAPRTLWPRAIVIEDVHHENWKSDVLALLASLGYAKVARSRSNSFLALSS